MHAIEFTHRFCFGIALAAIGLCAFAKPAHADSVFRCRAADGAVAFQDHACTSASTQSIVRDRASAAGAAFAGLRRRECARTACRTRAFEHTRSA